MYQVLEAMGVVIPQAPKPKESPIPIYTGGGKKKKGKK